MSAAEYRSFSTREAFEKWLSANHDTKTELWVRFFKKGSGKASIDWNDCVLAVLAWGWIDGQRKALDESSFLQRVSPRRAKSTWSKKNCAHAERLIAEGRMQPAGLAHVEAAKKDGRWEQAYLGSAEMVIPDDFLKELRKSPEAKRAFDALDRRNLFSIYHRVTTAKKPETRKARVLRMVAQLARGEKLV